MNSPEREISDCESEPDSLCLLQMPWLIIDYIINLMDRSDLMNLRLTCKTLKAWAERPKYLKKLRIHIGSKQSLNLILTQSQTHWNNFHLHWNLRKPKIISLFASTFGDSIHILEFVKKSGDCSGIVEVILRCKNLQILIIHQLDCSFIARLPFYKKCGLSQVLRNLEQLGIFELLCNDETDADAFIYHILSKCASSIKSVAVPVIIFPKGSSLHLKYDGNRVIPTDIFVMRPMIQLLESSARGLQTIVVKPESRSLLSDSALFCLSLLCYSRKIHLIYGTMTGLSLNLGILNYKLSPHPTMAEIASKIMTVMAATTDLLLNNEFGNLRKLIIQFNSFHINQDIFVVQHFPKLKALCVDFKMYGNHSSGDGNGGGGGGVGDDYQVKLRRMSMFVQGMLEVQRPSVRYLMIQNHDQVEQWIDISAMKLVNSFLNVKEISILHWNGDEAAFLVLWDRLRQLVKIEVKNCPNLDNSGILGKNWLKPAILNLKCLKELSLTQTGTITGLSYILAFRHMRLRVFHHQPLKSSDVSKIAYGSLIDGDFCHSIRFFSGTITYFGCSKRAELKEYLNSFDYLIEPQRDQILTEFLIDRCYNRLVKGLSKD